MSEIDRDVEVRMARTHQVKKALIRKAGLEGKVEPANDGLYQHDILLTEPQANALITEINQNKVGFGVGTMGRRKRAGSSIFFETGPFQRWPVGRPILYTFDPNLPEYNRETIRAAIREIQSRTCLNFQEARTRPSGAHLYYLKNADPAMCGSSPIGMVQSPYINVIRLSFQCADPKGVAIHETLHSLGLGHEHQRIDRDSFIRVNLANVYPQHHSAFYLAGVSTTTSYGIPYDYGSIMHYESSRGSMNGRKTMTAKTNSASNDPKMGQRRGLSNSDVEVLRRMYCMPYCNDNFVYCGVWATNGLCQLPHTQVWMIQNCRKSCNICAMRGRR